jgi:hypothetical protein
MSSTAGPAASTSIRHDRLVKGGLEASNPIGTANPLRRVSYQVGLDPMSEESFDTRALVTERFFNCTKTILLVGWWDDLVEPLKSFYEAMQRISGCNMRLLGTLGKESIDLVGSLNQSDVVIWWNWGYDIEKTTIARRALQNQVRSSGKEHCIHRTRAERLFLW